MLLISKLGQTFTILGLLIIRGPLLLLSSLFGILKLILGLLFISLWDTILFLINILTPQLRKGKVVKAGNPGHAGIWPPFSKPTDSDSRSPCPYLNALANHSILPHDGREISMTMLRKAIRESFNIAPTLTLQTTLGTSQLFAGKSVIDLGDLCDHRVIEHDASITRHDAYFHPNQGKPSADLIDTILLIASRPPTPEHPKGALSASDVSKILSLRIAQSKRDNPRWTGLTATHWLFMMNNSSLLLDVVDGDVEVLSTILKEERLPDGFEVSCRQRMGYTVLDFQLRSLQLFLGTRS